MKLSGKRFLALLMALVMCIGMFVSCDKDKTSVLDTVKKDPYKAIMDASNKYLEALCGKYSDVFAVFDKVSKGVGTYSLDIEGDTSGEAESVLAGGVGIDAVVDAVNCTYTGELSMNVGMGLTTGISLWGDKNNIALSAPLFLGEEKYGIKLDTFKDDFADSELFSLIGGGMSFDDFMDTLSAEMGVSFSDINEILDSFSIENLKNSFDKLTKDTEAVIKGITPEIAEGKFDEIDVVSVKYTLTKDDIKKLADIERNIYKELFEKFISLGVISAEDITGFVDEIDDEKIVFTYHLNKSSGIVAGMELAADDGTMKVNYGADVAKKFEMSADISATIDDEKTNFKMSIAEVTDEGKGGFIMTVNVDGKAPTAEDSDDAEELKSSATVSVIRNDADGKYEAKVVGDGEELAKITGKLTYSADEFVLEVDPVTSEDEDSDLGFTLSVKAGGKVEAIPEYKNILDITIDDLSNIMYLLEMLSGWSGDEEYDDEYYDDEYYDDEEYYNEEYEAALSMYEEFMADGELDEGEVDILLALYYGDMTEAEIAQFEQDLIDLGMSKAEFISMMFVEE